MKNTKEQLIKHKKNNVRLFPIYKSISWDLLFYFPIIFLFLTQIKGFSPSEVLLADSFYTLCNTFWMIPVTNIIDKIGKKNCLIIGNILYSVSIFGMIFIQDFNHLLLTQLVYALGFSIKSICETNILYDSLPAGQSRGKVFTTIDGKSSSYFFIVDAAASVIAGLTFAINGYVPMVLCFLACTACTILSFRFKDTKIVEEKVAPIKFGEYIGQLKDAVKFIKHSKRLKLLIVFNAVLIGIIYGIINLRSSMLSELNVSTANFGVIFALLQLAAAITARRAINLQQYFRNRVLMMCGIPIVISCIFIGIIGTTVDQSISVIVIFILFLVQFAIKGPYMASMSRYVSNFTNSKIRPKITAFKNLLSNLSVAIVSFICSAFLAITTSANTFIIIGCISTVLVILLLDYMRDKVGLKPEQYKDVDLKYATNKPKKEIVN